MTVDRDCCPDSLYQFILPSTGSNLWFSPLFKSWELSYRWQNIYNTLPVLWRTMKPVPMHWLKLPPAPTHAAGSHRHGPRGPSPALLSSHSPCLHPHSPPSWPSKLSVCILSALFLLLSNVTVRITHVIMCHHSSFLTLYTIPLHGCTVTYVPILLQMDT